MVPNLAKWASPFPFLKLEIFRHTISTFPRNSFYPTGSWGQVSAKYQRPTLDLKQGLWHLKQPQFVGMMAKPAFPVSFGNLMYFMYQLKNNLWASESQPVQSRQAPSSVWLGKLHEQCTQFEPTIQNVHLHPPCARSPWHLINTVTNKFDLFQVNLTEQRTELHLTVLKALVQGKICQIGSELLWAAKEMFCLPIVSIP